MKTKPMDNSFLSRVKLYPLRIRLLAEDNPLSPRIGQVTWAFIALGIFIRLVRYLLRFPLWPDEAFLAANFIGGSFPDMLGSLDYHQVSPLLFLWVELVIVKMLGFSEYTLRLFPFLCGVGSLFLFYHLGRRIMRGAPLLLAVAIFAVSYYPIRHGAEVKPYSTDLMVSLVLLTLAVEWLHDPRDSRWLWCLALLVPVAVGLSFTAVFVAGGLSLGLLAPVWKSGSRSAKVPFFIFNLVLLGAFLLVYLISTGPQYLTESWLSGDPIPGSWFGGGAWGKTFPPLKHPLKLVAWLLDAHTGRMFAYPQGGKHGGSALTLLCFAVGAVYMYRHRRRTVLSVFLAPFILAFIAAALHRYPYGYSARFMLFLAPVICLLTGLGLADLLSFIRNEKYRFRMLAIFLIILALVGIVLILVDLVHPYKNREDLNSRAFARWFWTQQARDAELICVRTDLKKDFFPRLFEWGHSARYLCHQRIYSPLHRHGPHRPRLDLVSPSHPLRCVVFSVPEPFFPHARRDEAQWKRWRSRVESRYNLVGVQEFEVNSGQDGQVECYQVYEFAPR